MKDKIENRKLKILSLNKNKVVEVYIFYLVLMFEKYGQVNKTLTWK